MFFCFPRVLSLSSFFVLSLIENCVSCTNRKMAPSSTIHFPLLFLLLLLLGLSSFSILSATTCGSTCRYDSDCTSDFTNPCTFCLGGACSPMCGVGCRSDSDCAGGANPCTVCNDMRVCANPRPSCGSFCGTTDMACRYNLYTAALSYYLHITVRSQYLNITARSHYLYVTARSHYLYVTARSHYLYKYLKHDTEDIAYTTPGDSSIRSVCFLSFFPIQFTNLFAVRYNGTGPCGGFNQECCTCSPDLSKGCINYTKTNCDITCKTSSDCSKYPGKCTTCTSKGQCVEVCNVL